MVERAVTLEPALSAAGFQALRDYCWRAGRKEEARAWNEKLEAANERRAHVERESSIVRTRDRLAPCGLPEEEIDVLRAKLRLVPGLRKAFLARKIVPELPDEKIFVLAFTVTPAWRLKNGRDAREVQKAILRDIVFPYPTLVFCAEGDNRPFARKLGEAQIL
jgi:hypothetical protein